MAATIEEMERQPRLYFRDGDIVLRAIPAAAASDSGPQRFQVFRVHKFLLKHHSAPLGHLFEDASVTSDETYDGVPMATMHGDRAEDLGMLLNYIYNPAELSFTRFDPNTPLIVSGTVRIADKYLIEPLRDRLIKQVSADWPTSLEEWDRFDAELISIRKNVKEGVAFCDLIPEPVSAILFAQEFGCPQILSAAFYQLSRIKYGHEWDNAELHNTSTITPLARWSLLDRDPMNLVRCLHGFQRLDDFNLHPFEIMSAECREECLFDPRYRDLSEEEADERFPCIPFLRRLISLVWDNTGRSKDWNRDPLRLLQDCLNYWQFPELSEEHFPEGLCELCVKSLPVEIAGRRQLLWNSLPNYFKL